MSDYLWPMDYSTPGSSVLHLSPEVCSNSYPLSRWCYLINLFSASPFYFCLQFFPASGTFPMSQLFPSSGQSIAASVSESVLPMNIQEWFPLGLTGLISFLSKELSGVFSSTTVQKHQLFSSRPSSWSNSHICTTTGKITVLTIQIFVGKVMSLLFNMLSEFVAAFLPRSKHWHERYRQNTCQ